MKFNAPVENIPSLTRYHRRVIKRGLKTVWNEKRKDIDLSANPLIVNLRDDDDKDRKFTNLYAEYITMNG
jgi:hypothetical protein